MGEENKRRFIHNRLSKRFALNAALFLAFISIFPNIAGAEIVERIVANVNGKIILLSEVRQQMGLFRSMKAQGAANLLEGEITEREVLRNMIDEKIMVHYAKESNVDVKESEIDKQVERVKESNKINDKILDEMLKSDGLTMEKYRKKLHDQILVQKITSIEAPPVTISDDEVKSYYNRNKELFVDPGKVRASHIIILASDESGGEYILEAEKQIDRIHSEIIGGADFAETARKYSQDGSSQNGGDLGWFSKGKMLPKFEEVAFSMKKGEVSEPVRTGFGFHLIKLTDREDPRQISVEEVMESIRSQLRKEAQLLKRKAWIDRLRSQAYVEILY